MQRKMRTARDSAEIVCVCVCNVNACVCFNARVNGVKQERNECERIEVRDVMRTT